MNAADFLRFLEKTGAKYGQISKQEVTVTYPVGTIGYQLIHKQVIGAISMCFKDEEDTTDIVNTASALAVKAERKFKSYYNLTRAGFCYSQSVFCAVKNKRYKGNLERFCAAVNAMLREEE